MSEAVKVVGAVNWCAAAGRCACSMQLIIEPTKSHCLNPTSKPVCSRMILQFHPLMLAARFSQRSSEHGAMFTLHDYHS